MAYIVANLQETHYQTVVGLFFRFRLFVAEPTVHILSDCPLSKISGLFLFLEVREVSTKNSFDFFQNSMSFFGPRCCCRGLRSERLHWSSVKITDSFFENNPAIAKQLCECSQDAANSIVSHTQAEIYSRNGYVSAWYCRTC